MKYNTIDVFTPTKPAYKSFVERTPKINDYLVESLMTPGKQIVIYGHSGTGKTTLLLNKINQMYENYIITRCMEGMTFETIIYNAFEQLGEFYSEATTISKGLKINPSVTLTFNEIKTSLSLFETNKQETTSRKSIIPPQLTIQKLSDFLGEVNCCWILEDFHKVHSDDKRKLSQAMKVFVDAAFKYPNLKIIALGAVGTARQVVEYDKEMNNRVAEIHIPLMREDELQKIIDVGERLLNIKFHKDIKNDIIRFSCGLPAICHQLCLNICFKNYIYETVSEDKYNFVPSFGKEAFNKAVEKYVEEKSDTFKAEIDSAIMFNTSVKINKAKVILQGIIELKTEDFYIDDLIRYIQNTDFLISKDEIVKIVDELTKSNRSEILIYEKESNKFRFNNIFLKAYCKLRFDSELKSGADIKSKEKRIISKLLQAIELDSSKGLFNYTNSDEFDGYDDDLDFDY